MNSILSLRFTTRALATLTVLALAACGGGGVDSLTDGVIGGTGLKGPVANATVRAYAISGGTMSAQIGSTTTDGSGHFSVSIGRHSGPVMLQLSGGAYTDEATETTMPMAAGDVMSAVMPSVAAGAQISGVQMTPLTSMAQTMAQHLAGGMTDANIATANASVGNYFMVTDILHVAPINPLAVGSGNSAAQASINYGMTMAAMSQYANGQGMTTSSAIVTAMMSDASDGVMNGMMGSGSVMMGGMGMGTPMPATAGTSGLASAMSAFLMSVHNKSSVAAPAMQPLIDRLNGSNGQMLGASNATMVKSTVSGTVFNGTMQSATVSAFAISGGAVGAQIASTTTDAQGNFTMPMGSYAGPVMLRASGGMYADEATGTMMTMRPGDAMTAVMTTIASGASVDDVMVTPLTSMAQFRAQAMGGGMTDANIANANAAVGSYFMVGDILHVQPMNTLVTGSAATATQDALRYGMLIAGMSQYAKDLGMPVSSAFVGAMMQDAADGVMNGMMDGASIAMPMGEMMGQGMMQSIAGTSGLAGAMANFMGASANLSGATLADMAAMMEKLGASGGQLQ